MSLRFFNHDGQEVKTESIEIKFPNGTSFIVRSEASRNGAAVAYIPREAVSWEIPGAMAA